ncbi:thiamine pyrophosphate-dependent enzyme [Streptomyces sp. GESEQ-35]|uniref:thiamine pyrophosphate-dependent enzyme n=1 Tax=Streptomyces sp. GESEQ-35 TaxID=2812657 RepID=UPI001FF5817C|nr:thiamine pyrophosphate-dependent enzyme [Streptomyces sp. GESEQ-35]
MTAPTTVNRTVREAAFDVLRLHGLTTLFSNPGSTEVSFLTDLPGDLEFVLALHEGSVVGAATGWALAREEPALVLLHTTAGLGNAVGALATARVNRAPLVVLVGQQDRRHLAQQPFLAGRLEGLAGDYPVRAETPARAQDVPGAIGRAVHAAREARGPALVLVPMDDWAQPAEDLPIAAPAAVRRSAAADPGDVAEVADLLSGAAAPVLVVGAGADGADTWGALTALAERLDCPVWQEPFGARAGFPQDHRRFAGHLPADRPRLRTALAPHDLVLCVGAPFLRQYPYAPGKLTDARVIVVTDDPTEAHHSPVELAVVTPLADFCNRLARRTPPRTPAETATAGPTPRQPPSPAEPLSPSPGGPSSPSPGGPPEKTTPVRATAHQPPSPGELLPPSPGGPPEQTTPMRPTPHQPPSPAEPFPPLPAGTPGENAPLRPTAHQPPSPGEPLPPSPGGPPEKTTPMRPTPHQPPSPGQPLSPSHVLAALAERLPMDTVVVEETPSSRPDLHALLPARAPLGFLSAAMGGLGFALPAAVGVRMARPRRPVVAVVGDGSSLYQIQALWTAAHYGVGAVFVVLANGRYAVMDKLADQHGGKAPWPSFEEVSVAGLAESLGCPARRITEYADLCATLDTLCADLPDRTEPLVLEVSVSAEGTFQP